MKHPRACQELVDRILMHDITRRGMYRSLEKKHELVNAKIEVDPSEVIKARD